MAAKQDKTTVMDMELHRGQFTANIVGIEPLIFNAMPEKAKHSILFPPPPANAAEKRSRLKHDPLAEFRASVHRAYSDDSPTAIVAPSGWFKQGMLLAALRTPGAKKTEAGQLISVAGPVISIYGVPELFMRYVRSADMNRTPDIRTRAILRNWACTLTVRWIEPLMNERIVGGLLSSAGLMSGVGDWRTQKGNSDFGQYEMVPADNVDFAQVVAHGGRAAQEAALESPAFFDDETEQLYHWFTGEIERRGLEGLLGNGREEVA